ncbi:variable surface protein [Plasmodium gonderi]|uniref:Variable surface protein n=1 Tax=Plasmodium gonderi TaxID=77519 RepID=A0A1Y1JE66_PLAGO|nr:variable surface protein [Plasmodium gonderi]GAW79042.1 variable surface protein [Plasmodium gonderi]
MAAENPKKWGDILKGTKSHEMYSKFDKGVIGNDMDTYCNKLKESDNACNNDKCKLCKKIGNSLKILSQIQDGKTRRYGCLKYKYWVNSQILSLLGDDPKKEYDKTVLNNFSDAQKIILEKKIYDYVCWYDFKGANLKNVKEMNEKKDLHDYFSNYSTVKKYILSDSANEDECKNYLKHIKELYDRHKNECFDFFNYWTSDCPDYYKREKKYDPNKLLLKLQGKGSESIEVPPKKSSEKEKITFFRLTCGNEIWDEKFRHCALKPLTIEYTDDEDEDEDEDVAQQNNLMPGGIEPQSENESTVKRQEGDNSQSDEDVGTIDEDIPKTSTEEDGITPYLELRDDVIKWNIEDKRVLDCRFNQHDANTKLCEYLRKIYKGDFVLKQKPKFEIKIYTKESYDGKSVKGRDSNLTNTGLSSPDLSRSHSSASHTGMSDSSNSVSSVPDLETNEEHSSGESDAESSITKSLIIKPVIVVAHDTGSDIEDGISEESTNTQNEIFNLSKTTPFRAMVLTIIMLGIFFLGFLYFKFTPFGTWVRRKLGMQKKINTRQRKQLQRPQSRGRKVANTNMNRKRVQIAYQNR